MKFKISFSYNWYEVPDVNEHRVIVKIFYINGVAFTFDDVPKIFQDHPEIVIQANKNKVFTAEDLYKSSFYLIDEQCHPLMFELELENPELLPVD